MYGGILRISERFNSCLGFPAPCGANFSVDRTRCPWSKNKMKPYTSGNFPHDHLDLQVKRRA